MDTRKATAEYRLAGWAQTIRERMESGETVKAFCEGRGISRNAYFYWLRKLRGAACAQMPPTARGGGAVAECPPAPAGWVACLPPAAEGSGCLVVEVGKCRVAVTADTDPGLLGGVLEVLVALC